MLACCLSYFEILHSWQIVFCLSWIDLFGQLSNFEGTKIEVTISVEKISNKTQYLFYWDQESTYNKNIGSK